MTGRRRGGWYWFGVLAGVVVNPLSWLTVRLVPFARLERLVPGRGRRPCDRRADALAAGVYSAARHGPARVTCLPRAVTTHTMLGLLRYDSRIVIGGTTPDDFAAHAWVEVGSTVVGETTTGLDRYIRLVTIPGIGRRAA